MHRRRVSSGLNWKPHLMFVAGLVDDESEADEPLDGLAST